VKKTNVLWVILIVSCFLTASCDQIFERGRGISDWRGSARDLEGNWYVNGDRNRRAEIVSTPKGLEARNERGQASRLDLTSGGNVRALDWESGLRGNVRRDQIEWENGTSWTREARSR
jgi:predicted small secreted protein